MLGTFSDSVSSSTAREKPLPQVAFCSIEYPGYVEECSVPQAIENLGGQPKVDQVFRRTAQKTDAPLELSFHPRNPFSHPIPGDVVPSNSLLLKVVKRKRRVDAAHSDDGVIGEYTADVVGIVSKTARFRSAYFIMLRRLHG